MSELKKGDKLSRETSQGRTEGKVVKKQTTATKLKAMRSKLQNPTRNTSSNVRSPVDGRHISQAA
jgi:hypothetical protein